MRTSFLSWLVHCATKALTDADGRGVQSIVFEIVEKPPKRMAPDSQFIRGIAVAGGQVALGFALPIR